MGEISNRNTMFGSNEKEIFEMCGVKENQIGRLVLRHGMYHRIESVNGLINSEAFPVLFLNVTALMNGNSSEILDTHSRNQ